jgi:phosphatidylglycerophosphate synthase
MGFITREGLKALDGYHYKSGGYTKLDNLMNPFWEWVDSLIPITVAPNVITFVGFLLMAASNILMLYFDQSFTKALPTWVYITVAVCQFIYQTLDAVDGKHARKTKSSSPLGQLFDHGCDSFSVTFLILSVCQSIRMGPTTEVIFFFNLVQFAFFSANWGEYHTGVLKTNLSNFGVTEGELLIAGAIVICGVFGYDIFDTTFVQILTSSGVDPSKISGVPSWILNIALRDAVLKPLYVVIGVIISYYTVSVVLSAKEKVLAVSQFVPLIINMIATWLWSTLPVFQRHAALVLLISGMIYSLNTCKIIVCSLTQMKKSVVQLEYIVYLLGYFIAAKYQNETADTWILLGLALYMTVSAIFWAKGCIEQIASYLGIYCLNLEKRERKKIE